MISLHRLAAGRLHRLAGLRTRPGQGDFVGHGAEMILDPTPEVTFHEIRAADGRTVGMFKLDPLYWQRHGFATPNDIGLRGLLIDAPLQGRGFGGAALAALPAHVRDHYPERRALVLTVNVANPVAYRAYLRAGLEDRGEFYQGPQGAEHILWLGLERHLG